LAFLALSSALAAGAQPGSTQPGSSFKINFPGDSPVAVVSADWGESRTTTLGGALVLELHSALSLRNSSQARIRSVTLLVLAQDVTPGGKASVSVPSLDVRPGETFPVRIDLRLLRPVGAVGGPLLEVSLDGVLFDNLSFYGPNRLNSRRSMTAWELEARRDRRHFKSVLEAQGPEGLRKQILASLARQAERTSLDVQVTRRGRASAVASAEREHPVQFAFLRLPEAPLEPVSGLAQVSGNEARAPHLEVLNRSDRPIRYFEIGWIIKDRRGGQFLAGSVPASDPSLKLEPGQKSQVLEDASLKFSRRLGEPLAIEGLSAFVSQVEFADGDIWIPSRAALADPLLERVLAPSPEEQRLTDLYRKRGLVALINELRKF
jgi:hypothetical protein